nr:uncharacterized protein LOC118048668 [Populus alba]
MLLFSFMNCTSTPSLLEQPAASFLSLAGMTDSLGTSHPFPYFKSLSSKTGGMFCHCGSPNKYKRLDEYTNHVVSSVNEELKHIMGYLNSMTSKMGSPELQTTFDTIVEAFLFLDKNGNGKL